MSSQSLLLLLSSQLRMTEHATALALCYLHKLQKHHTSASERLLDDATAALACLSLASKMAEQPRRLSEILLPAHTHLQPDKAPLTIPSTEYDTLRASLVNAELLLLRVIQFDCRQATPFEFLPRLLKRAVLFETTHAPKQRGEGTCRAEETPLGLLARTLCLEGLQSRQVALFFTAKTIAAAAILRALGRMHIDLVHGSRDPRAQMAFVADACKLDLIDVQECVEAFP
ncbi:hypothetical protein BCR37DRAFT_399223 [Protomyces lactucae-debilis]|uniref:Uncharacterized protein n=1 Tax=Protomyces lactucae-debilis TaxID=2754530 RepID=A0A1Y2FBP7_PROLT|nr:uncharacterized protein BCR37DRAFT_399223 [Protomyces lactucae-debilis]ORY80864.1 hypothetical protein BCR37DRAFT_399223 [Protomyces lactucae-debilis]